MYASERTTAIKEIIECTNLLAQSETLIEARQKVGAKLYNLRQWLSFVAVEPDADESEII
jgi:hypothetical protein